MISLQEALRAKVGGSLSSLDATNDDVRSWNKEVAKGRASSFDYRVLLGLGIDQRKPGYGETKAYYERVGEELDHGARWIYLTVEVALDIQLALKEDVPVPGEIRTVPWHLVPSAITNLRDGRALDDFPKSDKPEEGATRAALIKEMKKYIRALGKMEEEQAETVRESVALLLKFAKKNDIAVP